MAPETAGGDFNVGPPTGAGGGDGRLRARGTEPTAMTLGADAADAIAHELSRTEFDAVERDGLRAAWTDDDARVEVTDLADGETLTYDAEDLVRATSDAELRNARTGAEDVG
jgi:hypothetical protein